MFTCSFIHLATCMVVHALIHLKIRQVCHTSTPACIHPAMCMLLSVCLSSVTSSDCLSVHSSACPSTHYASPIRPFVRQSVHPRIHFFRSPSNRLFVSRCIHPTIHPVIAQLEVKHFIDYICIYIYIYTHNVERLFDFINCTFLSKSVLTWPDSMTILNSFTATFMWR